MFFRRDRYHHTGSSNLDFRASKTDMTPKDEEKGIKTRLSFLSTAKSKNFDEVIKKKISRTPKDPFEATGTLYGDVSGKDKKDKTKITFPRTSNLEEKEKMKLVFTGESELIYDKNLEKYRDHSYNLNKDKKKKKEKQDHLIKMKHDEHANAQQETQLIRLDKYTLETLKNNVDLEKVREIRRALRRRYATRKNLAKIYASWDEDHTGYISTDNVYTMMKRLGLNVNFDEARVLIASANKSGSGDLSLDEFLDLIYNHDDALNINFDVLAKGLGDKEHILRKEELEKEGGGDLLNKLKEDAKKGREIKHYNQVNLVLKNKLNELALNFVKSDPNKQGYINQEKFAENIRKLGINEKVITEQDIKDLYNRNKDQEHTINYRKFIGTLKEFQFIPEHQYKENTRDGSTDRKKNNSSRNSISGSVLYGMSKMEKPIEVVDCRNLPYSQMMNYMAKARKVGRALKRFFPKKDDLKQYFSEALQIDKEQIDDTHFSKYEFRDNIIKLFGNFDTQTLTKLDYQGFLSSFLYNKHGTTSIKDITSTIYDEEESDYIHKITHKQNGPAPPKTLTAAGKDDYEDDEVNYDEQGEESPNKDSDLPSGKKMRNMHSSSHPVLYSSARGGTANGGFEKPREITQILNDIDKRLFGGTVKAYDVFKRFDVDKDGFISRKDMATKVQEMNIIPKHEIPTLLRYLDPEKKGFVRFHEFHRKIRSNMTQQDENGEATVLPYVIPSKSAHEEVKKGIDTTKKKVNLMLKSVDPDFVDQKPKTRYGNTPSWKNTFMSFQPDSQSPMFISEGERFNRNPMMSTLYQTEDREKKNIYSNARIDNIKTHSNFFSSKIADETHLRESRDRNKLHAKHMAQTLYEHKAKLLNNPIR